MLGSTLLQAFPPFVTLLVFVAALLLAMVLYYRCFLLYSDTLLKSRAPILLPQSYKPIILTPPTAVTGISWAVPATAMENTVNQENEANMFANTVFPTESPNISDLSVTPSNDTGETVPEKILQKYREYYHLSARETDVLEQVLQDRPINEMAEALFISPRTVKFHVASLLKKTGCNSQRALKQALREFDRMSDNK
jgi:DNA-binding CsgD family transcriptional regulator